MRIATAGKKVVLSRNLRKAVAPNHSRVSVSPSAEINWLFNIHLLFQVPDTFTSFIVIKLKRNPFLFGQKRAQKESYRQVQKSDLPYRFFAKHAHFSFSVAWHSYRRKDTGETWKDVSKNFRSQTSRAAQDGKFNLNLRGLLTLYGRLQSTVDVQRENGRSSAVTQLDVIAQWNDSISRDTLNNFK